MNDIRAEARIKGFVKGAHCLIAGDIIRTIQTDRLGLINGNVFVRSEYPFFIFQNGKWVAKILK